MIKNNAVICDFPLFYLFLLQQNKLKNISTKNVITKLADVQKIKI
jgi:hypothetical protein